MKTSDLLDKLKDHYRKPGSDRDGEVLITEAAPPGSDRRADLIRIGLWRSRGPGIDVHELKVSRADWHRELDDPGKAEAWWPYCHRFWIVAPSTDIVDPNTLPTGWGLMVPGRGRRFTVVTKATRKEPKVTVALMVELIRRTDNSRLAERDVALADQAMKIHERYQERAEKRTLDDLDYGLRNRLQLLEQLETELGVTLDRWGRPGTPHATPAELAAAMKDLVADHLTGQRLQAHALQQLETLDRAASRIRDQVERIRAEVAP